jgi:hypothetical protein
VLSSGHTGENTFMSDEENDSRLTSITPNALIIDRLCKICLILLLGVELTGSDIAFLI